MKTIVLLCLLLQGCAVGLMGTELATGFPATAALSPIGVLAVDAADNALLDAASTADVKAARYLSTSHKGIGAVSVDEALSDKSKLLEPIDWGAH
jgi:membrane protein required for beta-lactamase induction